MELKIKHILLLLFLGTALNLQARHIIGGNLTYRCLGNGDFAFTLKVYRDCNCNSCAEIDPVAFFALYECSGNDCRELNQTSFVTRMDVQVQSISNVGTPDYPCLVEPDICVEEGIYEFRLSQFGVRLPNNEQTFHVSYQRCCRNVTINNLVRPQDAGATYTVELTPEARAVCNDAPTFNNFPPTVICNEAPLEFDHSAFDNDGDRLVYEFAAPLDGGGNIIDDPLLYSSCAGAYPNPACPPPYFPVTFQSPLFSPEAPMGGDPLIEIDPNTGLITGTPTLRGQYVVGVFVSEYRGDTLLSRTYRDFQFNVESCDPEVVADIKEDLRISNQEYQVNSCGITDIPFVNESFQRSNIDTYEWKFEIDGRDIVSNEWEPTISFPGLGEYYGTLILNPNTECGDTAEIYVNIYPDINADFEYETDEDPCAAAPYIFENNSRSGSDQIVRNSWTFGDGGSSALKDPVHTFRRPGDMMVTLEVEDINQCVASATKTISYFPLPPLIVIAPTAFEGCTPATIFFDNLSTPIDSTYEIDWDFGDGGSSDDIAPTYTYEDPGVFTVDVELKSPIGCKTDTSFNSLIRILPSPEAGFSFSPEQPTNLRPVVQFFDASQGGANWRWEFSTGEVFFQRNPVYEFRDTGTYEIKQLVTHPNGCIDSLSQTIQLFGEVLYHLPNAFTPNGDSKNDVYRGEGIMDGARDFQLTIWDRWGELVFESNDPREGWNGRKLNNGMMAPAGVYVVLATYKTPKGDPVEIKGFATLIR